MSVGVKVANKANCKGCRLSEVTIVANCRFRKRKRAMGAIPVRKTR